MKQQYIELQVTTNFSFLKGASHPHEMMAHAKTLGYSAIAITDVNTMAGIVRAHVAAKKEQIKLLIGCYVSIQDGTDLLVYPKNLKGYESLCALLSIGNLRAQKGDCIICKSDIAQLKECIVIIVSPMFLEENTLSFKSTFIDDVKWYQQLFEQQIYLSMQRRYNGNDQKMLYRLQELSHQFQIPLVATNDVFYHEPNRRQLQDVITCIKEKCTIHNAGYKLYANAERFLKDEIEMQRLFRQYPEAIENTVVIADQLKFNLDQLKYEYPEEIINQGVSPDAELEQLSWKGATAFYGNDIPQKVKDNILYELKFIKQMNYAAYFLTVYDIVKFARNKGILCQGRGSAANSTVCFCLGITSVNPAKFDLLFERFLSNARNEPPDIDVDFEHERREEVIQYIYNKYGRDRAAIVATVTELKQKGVIRDVAKAMGLSLDLINKLSATLHRMSSKKFDDEMLVQVGLNPADNHLQKTMQLAQQFLGFPRQLGQHTGGFIITQNKLHQLCPIINARMPGRTNIEWNKDDIEALGFLKIDVLALGMLTCIRKCFDKINQHYKKQYTLANIPQDDEAVYDMICKADTIGVFQIESRAQMQMLPRLKPRCFYDLVIQVAIVRPGPIQGDMVHPYLRRRNGEEKVDYPSEALRNILDRTLGVPLFQEQAMKVAIVAGGFTPSEADALRRSMATFKMKGDVGKLKEKLISGMIKNGYQPDYAERVFKQLEGFGSYGFPESHAASFALLVYVSCYIKHYYPDVFACALLNSLPMGFYQPAQIVQDAQKHSVVILPVDINFSDWDNLLETKTGNYFSIRLGFRNVKGIGKSEAIDLVNQRNGKFENMFQIMNLNCTNAMLERLAEADAFNSIGLDRRNALWHLSVKDKPIGLFAHEEMYIQSTDNITLPTMLQNEHVLHDYHTTALSLKAHPISFLRAAFNNQYISVSNSLGKFVTGTKVAVAGLVLVRQRPSTAKGVWFITLEDETGVANIIFFPQVAQMYKNEILQSRLLIVEGTVQVVGLVVNVLATKCINATNLVKENLRSEEIKAKANTAVIDNSIAATTQIFKLTKNFE